MDSEIVGKCGYNNCKSNLLYSSCFKYTRCKNCNENIKLFGEDHLWDIN